MSDYPRELLITEDVIREFEEKVGVRFINKTECSKALAEHDAKVRATAIEEFISEIELDKPMHFTKEQTAWIKKYVILKRHDAIDELVKEFDKSIKSEIRREYWWTDVVVRVKKIGEQLKEG